MSQPKISFNGSAKADLWHLIVLKINLLVKIKYLKYSKIRSKLTSLILFFDKQKS